MSPHPGEREDEQEDHDEPAQRHPPCGVESHEIGTTARLRTNLVPAPPPVVDGFDLVFAMRTGLVGAFDHPGVRATDWRGLFAVRHDSSSLTDAARDDAGGRPGRRRRRRVEPLVAPLSDGMRSGRLTYRSERNAARTSVEKSSGSSQAAKWPPLSTSLKYARSG